MNKAFWSLLALVMITGTARAQDFLGPASVGSSEPLFEYDDPDPWKHGYLKLMPYYGGYHKGLPYNYHHVFSQTQTSVGWGMPHGMPYSQQWWHRYESMADPGRAATEPNGYYGRFVPRQPAMRSWAAAPRMQQAWPGSMVYEQQAFTALPQSIAPAQFTQPASQPGIIPQGPALP